MRRLHAVGKQEIFVASGIYEFEQAGKHIGLTEHWSIHEVGGAQFIRVDQDGRAHDGRSILYEALRSPDGQIERIDLRAYGNAQDVVKQVRAGYTFFDGRVEVIRAVNNEPHFEEVVFMPADSVIAPSKLLYGFAVPLMKPSQIFAFFPNYDFANPQRAFKWRDLTFAGFQFAGWEQIEVGGKSYSAQRYQVHNMPIWLDQYDILLREETPTLVITLKQYARRPEPQTHD
jgi:hypothetical protein